MAIHSSNRSPGSISTFSIVQQPLKMPAGCKKRHALDQIPGVLLSHLPDPSVRDSGPELNATTLIDEKAYYAALEKLLSTRPRTEGGADGTDAPLNSRDTVEHISSRDLKELETYHLGHLLCGGWLFDHEAHARCSYYPSDLFPLGSYEECAFFVRTWPRNVNYPYARRLYRRNGGFGDALKDVPLSVCPCTFLAAFSFTDEDLWTIRHRDTTGGGVLPRLAVENELLFRSDFFSKRKSNRLYTHTNRWVYNTFVRHYHDGERAENPSLFKTEGEQIRTYSGDLIAITNNWFAHRALESRGNRRQPPHKDSSGATARGGSENVTTCHTTAGERATESTGTTDDRRNRVCRILNSLYFDRSLEKDPEDVAPNTDSRLLARCEDHRSFLYAPLLKSTSCKHEEEQVSFVQRRSGDEIATELRKCKACGRVRTM